MEKWQPEYDSVPDSLREEQKAVEASIRDAFRGVTRDGGVSWSEANVIDDNGSKAECAVARASDREPSWEGLVEDATWYEDGSNWSFLDAIGLRYYIAPAMIRCTRSGGGEFVGYALEPRYFKFENITVFTPAQIRVIARFARFMVAVHHAVNDHIYGKPWEQVANAWSRWEETYAQEHS